MQRVVQRAQGGIILVPNTGASCKPLLLLLGKSRAADCAPTSMLPKSPIAGQPLRNNVVPAVTELSAALESMCTDPQANKMDIINTTTPITRPRP